MNDSFVRGFSVLLLLFVRLFVTLVSSIRETFKTSINITPFNSYSLNVVIE